MNSEAGFLNASGKEMAANHVWKLRSPKLQTEQVRYLLRLSANQYLYDLVQEICVECVSTFVATTRGANALKNRGYKRLYWCLVRYTSPRMSSLQSVAAFVDVSVDLQPMAT